MVVGRPGLDGTRTDLGGVLAALRRHRWVIVSTASLAVALGLVVVLVSDPVYEARTEVLLEPDVPFTDPELVGRTIFFDQELSTQLRLVTSDLMLRAATDALGLPRSAADEVTAVLEPDTRVITIASRDGDPQRAADVAESVAASYLAFRRQEATSQLVATVAEVESQIGGLELTLDELDEQIEATGGLDPRPTADRFAASTQLGDLRNRLTELQASLDAQTGGGRVIEPAEVPDTPVAPTPVSTSAVALLLGLGVGVLLAMVRDTLDEAVRSDDDVTEASGLPVIGRVPRSEEELGEGLVLLETPESPIAEAYRDLRSNLRFAAADVRSVAVTSSIEGEGKTSVAANVAVAASLAGFDVVLVDADLRRPRQHSVFGVPKGIGLSDVLAGEQEVADAGTEFDEPPLRLITAGRQPPNPSELLGSQRLADVLAELTARHELVIVDTPPTMAAPDAQEVASLVDATIVVVEHDRAGRRSLRETVGRLTRAGARVVGAVGNRVDPTDVDYGYYYRKA
ncbi:polysaccharide biosynthesis tyrosine autokinase [Nitriliruptoraceae bacterium ZYF776]|nr:polysaccharide biosynthesis tyrosine autokinase [Profundirhabdus halotolerans]